MTVAKKGISSCQVSRELGITQKSAWFLLSRVRESWSTTDNCLFAGENEIDEVCFGGKKNRHKNKILKVGRGVAGKSMVVGIKELNRDRIKATSIQATEKDVLHSFVKTNVSNGSTIYTDEHRGYIGLSDNYLHKTINHSIGEYVKAQISTNGIESF